LLSLLARIDVLVARVDELLEQNKTLLEQITRSRRASRSLRVVAASSEDTIVAAVKRAEGQR
jgi:hypothetical protein